MEPQFFETLHDLRAWFEVHHATDRELVAGFRLTRPGEGSSRNSVP